MSKGIRRYGPGKFNTILDSYVYDLTNEGWEKDSCGDVSEVGFFASSVELDSEALKNLERIAKENKDSLTDEEKDLISESVGAILVENDQGFVVVDYYDNDPEFEKDWAEVEDDASGEGDDSEEEEEEDEESEAEEEDAETEEA